MNYYNDNDPRAVAWLRELIAAGHIAPGEVDDRGIADVCASDLAGYQQCHFFAGIGGWALALRLSGWPDDSRVWTGSCPCQPFSAAGKKLGADDPRHLWPFFRNLIGQCRPPVVFGEQVASKDGRGWLAGVCADLEALAYRSAAADLCAAGVSAPHIRQRLFWVADTGHSERRAGSRTCDPEGRQLLRLEGEEVPTEFGERGKTDGVAVANGWHASAERQQRGGEQRQQPEDGGATFRLGDSEHERLGDQRDSATGRRESCGDGVSGGMGNTTSGGCGVIGDASQSGSGGHLERASWSRFEIVQCRDGKARRFEPESFPLADGLPGRMGLLRGYGNAIVPEVAACFVEAWRSVSSL